MSRARHIRAWILVIVVVCCAPVFAQTAGSPASELASRAAAARDSGDIPQAIQLYQQALAADPHWTQGWWFLGNLQYQLNQYAAARDSLSQYMAASPKAVAATALRGLCEYELGALEDSLTDIEQAIAGGAANQPRNAQILLYHEALVLTRLGHFEEAITKYAVFAKQGVANEYVTTGLGLAGLRIAELPAAVPPVDLQIAEASGKAALQILSGDVTGGQRSFDALYAAYPNRANLHYFCGYVLLTSDPDQGVAEMRQELRIVPASKPALTMLGWTLELRGEYAEALPVAQEAVRDDQTSTTNQLVLGRALLEANDTEGALSHLNRVLAQEPQNLEAHISLAKAYSMLGRKEEAHQERLLCLKLADAGRVHAP